MFVHFPVSKGVSKIVSQTLKVNKLNGWGHRFIDSEAEIWELVGGKLSWWAKLTGKKPTERQKRMQALIPAIYSFVVEYNPVWDSESHKIIFQVQDLKVCVVPGRNDMYEEVEEFLKPLFPKFSIEPRREAFVKFPALQLVVDYSCEDPVYQGEYIHNVFMEWVPAQVMLFSEAQAELEAYKADSSGKPPQWLDMSHGYYSIREQVVAPEVKASYVAECEGILSRITTAV